MMKNYLLILISIVAILFFSCSKDDDNTPVIQRTMTDVFDDFKLIDISSGIHDEQLESSNGNFWNFRVIAPEIEGTKKYPLVIALHGASGGHPDAHKNTDCYIEAGFEDMEAFIISPNGGISLWHEIVNQEMVINLANFAKLTWPIDPDKILVTGYSNGGNGSWFYGEIHSNLFSVAIPMATSYTTIHPDGHVREMPIPMYVIHGENDALFPLADTEEWVNKTNEVGSNIKFVIAPGLEHNEPCSYVPYLQDGVQWVQDSIWQ